jgi:hypothetical protein
MPYIPDLTATQGEWKAAAPSTQAAAAPGLALAMAGRGLVDAGNELGELGLKIKAVRDHDALNQARLAFAQAQAAHAEFRAANQDQETWEGNLAAELEGARGKIAGLKMSPSARKSLDVEWQGWQQSATSSTRVAAIQHGVTRARQNLTNLDERYRLAGDFESSDNLYKEGVAAGILPPEEAESRSIDLARARQANEKKLQEQAELDEIAADPLGTRARLMENPPAPTADNATKAKHFRALSLADRLAGDEENRFTDTILNGMIGIGGKAPSITSPEEIERLGIENGVQPQIIAKLKGVWEEKHNRETLDKIAAPDYQMAILSDLESVIETANPGQSLVYMEAARLLEHMQPGPAKNHYSAEVKRVFFPDEPTTEGSDWVLDYALDNIRTLEKDGGFGTVPRSTPFPTKTALNNGALNSIPNLLAVGFTEAQAKEITQAKDKAGKITQETQLAAFRDRWTQRGKPSADADPFVLATMTAIGDGVSDVVMTDLGTQQMQNRALWSIRAKSGKVRDQIITWRKRHPEADDTAIMAEVIRLSGLKADEVWDKLPAPLDEPGVLPPRD